MVDTSYQPALGYMEIVERNDAQTLLPIIQAHTAPGTIVHSDLWAAYNRVIFIPGIAAHGTVNHSVTFVDQGYIAKTLSPIGRGYIHISYHYTLMSLCVGSGMAKHVGNVSTT